MCAAPPVRGEEREREGEREGERVERRDAGPLERARTPKSPNVTHARLSQAAPQELANDES